MDSTPEDAFAQARFGDTTWVAPIGATFADSALEGPRVASPEKERAWESVLRAPFRLVFLPVRLVAKGMEAAVGYAGPRYLEPKPKSVEPSGPKIEPEVDFGSFNEFSAGAAVKWQNVRYGHFKLAGTWSTHDRRRLRVRQYFGERRPIGFRLRADYDYKPNKRYYGIGNDTPESNRSYYKLATTSAEALLLFGSSPLRQFRVQTGYSSMNPGRGYFGEPLTHDMFTPETAPYANVTSQEFWYGLGADYAAIDDDRDPSLGLHGRADVRRAEGMRFSDPDYYRWRVEGRAYLPVFAKRRVLAFRGVYSGIEPDGSSETILPFYRLAQSQGITHFAGFPSGRFYERQLMLGRIEYRWTILHRLSAIGLYERGQVAPNAEAFALRRMHQAYGGGLRYALSDEKVARLEIARGDEGIRAVFAIGSDF